MKTRQKLRRANLVLLPPLAMLALSQLSADSDPAILSAPKFGSCPEIGRAWPAGATDMRAAAFS
jgi:hypothetical protein